MIRKMAGKYPQESYAAVVRAIQLGWIFLKCVMKNTGCAFVGVEKLSYKNFLPFLFLIKSKYFPSIVVTLSMIPVNKSGLGLQYPVTSADEKY